MMAGTQKTISLLLSVALLMIESGVGAVAGDFGLKAVTIKPQAGWRFKDNS